MSKPPVLYHYDLLQSPDLEHRISAINREPIRRRLKLVNAMSPRQPYPRVLYKYRPISLPNMPEQIRQLRDYLVESRLWLSSPSAFNDPFDMRGNFKFDGKSQLKRKHLLKKLQDHRPDLTKAQREHAVSELLAGGDFSQMLRSAHERQRAIDPALIKYQAA